jgi:hypothetical protein
LSSPYSSSLLQLSRPVFRINSETLRFYTRYDSLDGKVVARKVCNMPEKTI